MPYASCSWVRPKVYAASSMRPIRIWHTARSTVTCSCCGACAKFGFWPARVAASCGLTKRDKVSYIAHTTYENKDERTAIVAYWSLASFAATHAASSSCANISSASISKFGRTCTYPQTTCASAAL